MTRGTAAGWAKARARGTALPLVGLVAFLVAGCAEDGATPTLTPARPGVESPAAEPSPTSDAGTTFENPVLDRNFADPHVIEVDGTYYAYATGNLTFNIQVSTSENLVEWGRVREALPRLPLWQPTSKGLTWAPEVIRTSAGYVMHYTARDVQAGRQCLSVAVAEDPAGPFVDDSEEPLLCQYELGGSIDSSPFLDEDGTLYLLWKNDGNCCGIPTRIFIQEMTPDGLDVVGEGRDVGLAADQPWERGLIEAPFLWRHEGTYYLFYSGNHYNTRDYAIGYASSESVLGPYVKSPENPLLATRSAVGDPAGDAAGPGHNSIVVDDAGQPWIVYHAWDTALVGDQLGGRRALWLDPLTVENDRLAVDGPNAKPQPLPTDEDQ